MTMRGLLGVVASLVLVGCVGMDDAEVASSEAAVTIASPVEMVGTVQRLPAVLAYSTLPEGFRFVPETCHFIAFITFAAGQGEFLTNAVCTRPQAILWRVGGHVRSDLSPMRREIARQTTEVRAELERQATTSGALVDFGTGGGGDFGRIGPGPIGPGPGGPGGHPGTAEELFQEAARIETQVHAGAGAGIGDVITSPIDGVFAP
jgi:hypothetical protein